MSQENRMISFNGQDVCSPEETSLSIRYGIGRETTYGVLAKGYLEEKHVFDIWDFWVKHEDACISMDEELSATFIENFIYDMNLPNEGEYLGGDEFDHYGENVYDIEYFDSFLGRFDELSVMIQEQPQAFLQYYKLDREYGPNLMDIVFMLEPSESGRWLIDERVNTPEFREDFALQNLWAVSDFYKNFCNVMREIHKRWPDANKFSIFGP